MKLVSLRLTLLISMMLCVLCCAGQTPPLGKDAPVFVFNPLRSSDPAKAGYTFSTDGATVRFIYEPAVYGTEMAPGESVYVVGSFNGWGDARGQEAWRMSPVDDEEGRWTLEKPYAILTVAGQSGFPEFKFLKSTGEWQEPDGWDSSYLQERNLFLDPRHTHSEAVVAGYAVPTNMSHVLFIYSPTLYGQELSATDTVYVVGTFNHWAAARASDAWRMQSAEDGLFYLMTNAAAVNVPGITGFPEFKFLTGVGKWQEVKSHPAAFVRNNNLWINFDMYGDITPPSLQSVIVTHPERVVVTFSEAVTRESALNRQNYSISDVSIKKIEYASCETRVFLTVSPIDYRAAGYRVANRLTVSDIADIAGNVMTAPQEMRLRLSRDELEAFFNSIEATDDMLGAVVGEETTVFRLFGPRLDSATLVVYAGPRPQAQDILWEKEMTRRPDYVWEVSVPTERVPHGTFYKYVIEREGETYIVSDPYAQANYHSAGNSIVIHPGVYDTYFSGWTAEGYTTPAPLELVIYETHLANITGRNPALSFGHHQYRGMTVDAPGTPLDYFRRLGVNAIEFLPFHEFQNGSSTNFPLHYHWGYMTSLFFAPESSYATNPAGATQVTQLKQLVNTLHNNDIAVIVDVVYNHTSNVDNYLMMIDPEYYFTGGNLSGCGNDTACHRPYMRKLIVDSLCHLLSEYHVDGFRFDLSHLIDQENLFTPEIIAQLNEAKPTEGDVILIAENWSLTRGELTGRGVAQWNDWFREDIKSYAAGNQTRDTLIRRLRGSQDRRVYATPAEVINYFESHDEETIAYHLYHAGHTEREDQLRRARMGALILFTSQGIPILWEGQEALRFRPAQLQDYESNVVDWGLMEKNAALVDYYRALIALRRQYPSLRSTRFEDDAFFQFIRPPGTEALGYILNADRRFADDPRIAVCVNPGRSPVTIELPGGDWMLYATSDGFLRTPVAQSNRVTLPAGGSALLRQE